MSQTGSLGGDSLEDIVDEAVHDGHGTAADTSVGVDLLHHFVDVDAVRFTPPLRVGVSVEKPQNNFLACGILQRPKASSLQCLEIRKNVSFEF